MDESDEIKGVNYLVSVITPANPRDLKDAFAAMIDKVIEKAGGVVVDWGSLAVAATPAITQEHQEVVLLQVEVQGIGFGTAEE